MLKSKKFFENKKSSLQEPQKSGFSNFHLRINGISVFSLCIDFPQFFEAIRCFERDGKGFRRKDIEDAAN